MAKSDRTLIVSLKFTLWETIQLYLLLTAQTGTWAQNDLYREIAVCILPSEEEKERFSWNETSDLVGRIQIQVEQDNFDEELSRQLSITQWELLFSTAEMWKFWPATSESAKLQEKMMALNKKATKQ